MGWQAGPGPLTADYGMATSEGARPSIFVF